MTPPATVHSIRNQSEVHRHERPPAMTHAQVERVIEGLEKGQKVLVWYRPQAQFKCSEGVFTYEGRFELDSDELDYVFNDRPMLGLVTSTDAEIHCEWNEETEDEDETEYTHVYVDILDDESCMNLISMDCTGIWSIEVRDDLTGNVEKVTLDEGSEFRFNFASKEASINGEELERNELVTLHQSLNRFLSQE